MTSPAATVTVRPLTAGDRADWDRMWAGYLAFYETERPAEMYDTAFARLTSDDPHEFSGLVAEVDGRPVGLAHYLFHRHGWQDAPVCYLQDLWADTDVRGAGVGRALIEGVYARADAAGAPQVYWMTQDFNAAARRLYDRVGKLTPFVKYARS